MSRAIAARPLAARLTRLPIPHDPGAGEDALRLLPALGPDLAALVRGAAGCSPYLAGLIARDPAAAEQILTSDPDAARDALLAEPLPAESSALGPALRRQKARLALLAALADLGGAWPLEAVTGALTAFADHAVAALLRALVGEEIRRGRIPGAAPDDAGTAAGLVALAMGKMGAGELNYSSDIDLVCLFDDDRFDSADLPEARAAFIRVTRRLTAFLSDNTDQGYVFRTDLRLRPDASVTPVCISMGAAEQYYEAEGRTWERAAYIKARAAVGDIAAGEAFLRQLTPFVWRRHLDYAAIQDAHDMRLRIRDHKGLHGGGLEGRNLKLAPGGIREIEFFTQTRQLIAGGRDPGLRARDTVGALTALAARGWVGGPEAEELIAAYRAHRCIEHRLQMVQDARTHSLPVTPEGFDRIARMSGYGDTDGFRSAIARRVARVAALTEGFFDTRRAAGGDATLPAPALPGPLDPAAQATVEAWAGYPALRSARGAGIFRRLQPDIIARLQRAAHPDEALLQFDAFLRGLPAGVQLFSLFEANPQLIDLIVDICATAPALAAYLARNAGVFDAVIGGAFFSPWPGGADLATALTAQLTGVPDYEARLAQARVWWREWHFRIGVHHLRGLIDAATAGRQYADLAEAAVAALWPVVLDGFAQRHGPPPGRGAVVLGMGSLGAGRLSAASDLDLIVIHDAPTDAVSVGRRPLPARTWYARVTQALVTALAAPMGPGRLYAVDMRLRPSGRQGPVATSLRAFRDYQMTEAWTWEHLALTRARVVAGPSALARDVEAARRAVLRAKMAGPGILAETAAMRARIFAARDGDPAWEAKTGPGRLQDIELLAQAGALVAGEPVRDTAGQLAAGAAAGLMPAGDAAMLAAVHGFLWTLQAAARLLTDRALDPDGLGEGGRSFLLRETGMPDTAALASHLAAQTAAAAAIVTAVLDSRAAEPDGGSVG
jgi:glutamate-ammonia-ligase adenylyltransferase